MWLLLNNGKTFLLKDHFERRLRFLSTFTNTNCTISSPDSAGSFGDISPLVPVPPAGLVPPCRPACRVVPVGPACPLSLAVLGRPRVLYFLSLLVGLSVISSRMTRLRQTGFTEVTQEHGERWRNKSKHLIYSFLRLPWDQGRFIYMKLYLYVLSKVNGRDGMIHRRKRSCCCLLFNWSAAKRTCSEANSCRIWITTGIISGNKYSVRLKCCDVVMMLCLVNVPILSLLVRLHHPVRENVQK